MQKNRGLPGQSGFTLIELLVVIAVIGILASVVIASLNSARVKSRNARRTNDIKQLLNAFNLGLEGAGALPSSAGAWVCVSASCYDGWAGQATDATVNNYLSLYLPQKSADPVGGIRGYGGYLYNSAWAGSIAFDGSSFPAGSYLYWPAEMIGSQTSCAPGRVLSYGANNAYASCMLQINP